MSTIPAPAMKGWRAYEIHCTGNRVTVKYKYVAEAPIRCKLCSGRMLRRGLIIDEKYLGMAKKFVTSVIDRSNAYQKALREHLPHMKISFDPFHIIKNVNDAIKYRELAQIIPTSNCAFSPVPQCDYYDEIPNF